MSHRLKFFAPLPPEAEAEVSLLFAEWRERYFPHDLPPYFEGDKFYDDSANCIEVPIPEMELREIDRRYGIVGEVNAHGVYFVRDRQSSRDFFNRLVKDAESEQRQRARRKTIMKIVVLFLIAVFVVWGLYSFM